MKCPESQRGQGGCEGGAGPGWGGPLGHSSRRPPGQKSPCPAPQGWDPAGSVLKPARPSLRSPAGAVPLSSRRPRRSQALAVLGPSLDLLQVFGPKGGRQQLLDRPDHIRAIRLGHVHGPVGAKLSHDLAAGPTWRDEVIFQVILCRFPRSVHLLRKCSREQCAVHRETNGVRVKKRGWA